MRSIEYTVTKLLTVYKTVQVRIERVTITTKLTKPRYITNNVRVIKTRTVLTDAAGPH